MKRIDELIKKETKLEKKRDELSAELEEVDQELSKVRKLRQDAEKIVARMDSERKKLDELLSGQVSVRSRKKQEKQIETEDSEDVVSLQQNGETELVASLQQSEESGHVASLQRDGDPVTATLFSDDLYES